MTKLSGIRKSSRLTDTQFLVLSEAAGRDGGFVVVPERLKGKAAESFVLGLITKGLVEEVRAKTGMPVWRHNGERGKPYALVITESGRKSIPIETSAQSPIAIATERSAGAAKGRARKGQPEATSSLAGTNEKTRRARNAQHKDVGQASKNGPTGANAPRPGSKLAGVIALLLREAGASLEELMAATGWLPHTTRAALTGLRKRGYVLLRERPEGKKTAYRILPAPHAQAA